MKRHYAELHRAVSHLLYDDEKGFKQADYPFAESLYNQKEWTERQARAVIQLLLMYRKNLAGAGIDYNKIKDIEDLPDVVPDVWTAVRRGKRIELKWKCEDRNKFFETLNNVKDIPGKLYDKNSQVWSVPLTELNVKIIKNMGFQMNEVLKNWAEENLAKSTTKSVNLDDVIKRVNIPELYPFQEEGLSFIERMGGICGIWDEQGLGKTLQSLAYLKLHPELRKAIIIVPASLKLNWERETKRWVGEECYIVEGTTDDGYLTARENIIIINYDIMKYHVENLKSINPKSIILDEVHRIKNSTAQRSKSVRELCKHRSVESVIALSGTPLMNRPIELWNIISILRPDVFTSHHRYKSNYCPSGGGVSNAEQLHDMLTEYVMVRRLKKDVLKELPDKTVTVIPFPIMNRSEYDLAEQDVIEWIAAMEGNEKAMRASRAQGLAKFNCLKKLASEGKMEGVTDWIDDFLESGEKLVLFCVSRKVVACLMEKYGDIAVKIDGSTSTKERQTSVDRFQKDDKVKIFVGNIQAASEGITLTAASNVAIIELAWSPALHSQAQDRVHRIGQKNASNIYYLIAENTIEEEIVELLDGKQKIIDAVMNGEDTEEESLLAEMMEKYKTKTPSK